MQAEPHAVTTEALLSTLFSGPDTGGSLSKRKCRGYEKKKTQNRKAAGWMLRGMHSSRAAQILQREITQLVVSMWKPLHFIFLIEPPAAPTSRAGPKRPTAAVTKKEKKATVRTWPVRVQTQSARGRKGRRAGFFHVPVSLGFTSSLLSC